ncbi:hypothetical protein IEQ34_001816 [Dendrobium chrysotoxum]|uniref:Uncharacterized protein n=1 Tax=Dendrobium chrysotoxum TaxID=161865 RepID=A0AAV7HRN4_DENCH|nr:hypothetical protein IEQ34_001816 [Dendrobium chrysotoxum]
MSNHGLEDVGQEAFHILEEYLEEEKRRKAQLQSYGYYYGRRQYSDYYYVAKPVQSNIPQPKRQPVVTIDSNEAAKRYGGVIFARKQEIRKPYRLAF